LSTTPTSIGHRACDELATDPLHNLSLNSKELFHSNFLAWLASSYPEELSDALDGIAAKGDPGHGGRAEREREGLDLVLRLPRRRPLVIENKVWSLPDEHQLARYATGPIAKLDGDPQAVLLSLIPPAWPHSAKTLGDRQWRHVAYDELAGRLAPVAAKLRARDGDDDRFAGELLKRYVVFVQRLTRLAVLSAIRSNDETVALNASAASALRRARVHDGVAKLRAHQVVNLLHDRLHERFPTAEDLTADEARVAGFDRPGASQFLRVRGRAVGLEAGFSNGNPLNSGQVALGNGDRLIWQYQSGQWRLAVTSAKYSGRADAMREQRHDYIERTYGDWFDFSPVAAALGADRARRVEGKSKDARFHRYDPDFAYRYCRIDDPTPVTVNQLVELGVVYLRTAIEWSRASCE
jgi:hypothetical protein